MKSLIVKKGSLFPLVNFKSSVISVSNLKKNFSIFTPKQSRLRKVFAPKYDDLPAVDGVNFEVQRGEKIAFIGPNGAGKSTTIKLLTGIFQPTSGSVQILGLDPFTMRKKVAYKIGTVFGQRSQLWYHLPPFRSFKLLATIYDLPHDVFENRLKLLIDIFDLNRFYNRPVKELSLGERMRCELVASLLHNPEILFLDEPTIGLDIISKSAIRELVHQRSQLDATTIFLTSHDVADIERVCDRIILINKGKIVVDDSVKTIKERYIHHKRITVRTSEKVDWKPHPSIRLISSERGVHHFEVELQMMSPQEAVRYIANQYDFSDITIEDLPLEDIIRGIYQS